MDPLQLYKLAALSVAVETAALALLATRGDALYLFYWLAHGCAAALAALIVWRLQPEPLRHPRRYSLSLAFLLILLFPLFGVVGMLGAIWLALVMPRRATVDDTLKLAPKLKVYAVRPGAHDEGEAALPAGRVVRIVGDVSQPTALRIRAVLALRDMPARIALPLLRRLLADPDEEIRLLAYGVASNWEQRLTAELQRARREFDAVQGRSSVDPDELARAARQVAELQFELVYQGVAQGDLRRFAIEQSWAFAQTGLRARPADPTLLILQLRLAIAREDFDAGQEAIRRLDGQVCPVLWVPYAAELAWMKRDFAAVRALLSPMRGTDAWPVMRPVLALWTGAGK